MLIHFYRQTDIAIINYGIERLQSLAKASKKVKIAPIFSSEGADNTADLPFMGDWLELNPVDSAFESWISQFSSMSQNLSAAIDVVGAVWFTYGRFKQANTSHIYQQPISIVAKKGESKAFNVKTAATRAKFYWEKDGVCLVNSSKVSGATGPNLIINNIDDSDTGTYFCRVISFDQSNPSSWVTDRVNLTISQLVTLRNTVEKNQLVLHPNPSSTGIFNFIQKQEEGKVYDNQGNLIESLQFFDQIDLSAYPSGMYLLIMDKQVVKLLKL